MCDSRDLEEMDTKNARLSEYFLQNFKLEVIAYSEEEPQNLLSLNLTNTGITCLDNHLLSLTPCLQSIDLSNNLLKDLSNLANIDLPHLKKLDLKNNQISDFSFLTNFQSLEDLDIRGNNFDISITYWTVSQLSKLKHFNGEDINEIRKYLTLAELQVISNIDSIFSNEFEVIFKNTEHGILQIKKELINCLMKKCGIMEEAQFALTHKVQQFVDNKLNYVFKNILRKVKSNPNLSNNIAIKPNVRQQSYMSSREGMPQNIVKEFESDILSKAISEAIGELRPEIKPSIFKSKSNDNIYNCQIDKEESLNSNSNALKRKPLMSETSIETQIQRKAKNNTFPLSYELIKILRKHSRKADSNDSKTSIWDIKYRPIGRDYRGSHLVATCGANIVNLIDLKTLSVYQRYEDNNSDETFNCIAWNDFIVNTSNGRTRHLSLLCVGATKKINKLTNILFLNADDVSDYLKIRGHSQSVNCLLFHPTQKNLLFSGSYDRKIMVWKLDSGKMTHLSRLSSLTVCKLTEIDCNNRILSSVFAKNLNILVVSGEDGIVLIKPSNNSSDKNNTHLIFKVNIPEKKKVIDGLVMIGSDSNLIAFRLKEFIIVADLKRMIESVDNKGVVPLVVSFRLKYCTQKCDYFYMTIESRLLCCGSADGQILLYYLKDSIIKCQQKENLLEPIIVLPKPTLNNFYSKNNSFLKTSNDSMFVNMTAISPNHEYIVSGTNNNLICVWKRINPLSQNRSNSSSVSGHKKLKTLETI